MHTAAPRDGSPKCTPAHVHRHYPVSYALTGTRTVSPMASSPTIGHGSMQMPS